MTIQTIWTLSCDVEGCQATYQHTESAAMTRLAARDAGWTFQQKQDRCAEHSMSSVRLFSRWIESRTRPSGGYREPILVARRPARVWRILAQGAAPRAYAMPEITAAELLHGRTAHLEDEGHDWNWRGGELRYNGADGDTWLFVQFDRQK